MFSAGRGATSPTRRLRREAIFCYLVLLLFHFAIDGSFGAQSLPWEQSDGFRSAKLTVPAPGKTGFQKLEPARLGILFTNDVATVRGVLNRNLLNGSGVALGDMDGDGLCDIYLCGLENDNALYRNLGDWRFQDVTAAAGVACKGADSTGAVFAD